MVEPVAAVARSAWCVAGMLVLLLCAPGEAVGSLGWIAYIQGDDLFAQELPDGQPTRLTHSGRNDSPRWSPSGEWIAYRHDAELWVIRRDGTQAKPLAGCTLNWSPVMDALACRDARGGMAARAVATADASPGAPFVPDARFDPYSPAWSPDGTWIAYARRSGSSMELWVAPADGARQRRVPRSRRRQIDLVGWSPDGTALVYRRCPLRAVSLLSDGVGAYAVPWMGGVEKRLAKEVLAHPDFMAAAPADWLAIVEGGYRGVWMRKRLVLVDPTTGKRRVLTDPSMAVSSPAWSPDGTRIAYVAMPDAGDLGGGPPARTGLMQRRVWVMRRDGSQPRRLTSAPGCRDERPQWSSDGSRILFARIHAADPHDAAADRAEIWLMHADGRGAEPVVRDLSIRQEASSGAGHLMWFGYYGHIDWELAYDWWRPARPRQCARALGDAALSAVAAARAGC